MKSNGEGNSELCRVEELGMDKCGNRWLVKLRLLPSISKFPITQVNFSIFSQSKLSKPGRYSVGKGFLSIEDSEKTVAKIPDIRIEKPFENRGLGSLLLRFMENWAIAFGIKKIWGDLKKADVNHHGGKLEYFYTKHGYTFQLYSAQENSSSTLAGKIWKLLP